MEPVDNVLIIAFDGLDYQLIQKFDCDALRQNEIGRIDNQTGMKWVKTSELFASFLTGTTHEVHGVTGLSAWENKWKGELIRLLLAPFALSRISSHLSFLEPSRGFRRTRKILEAVLNTKKTWYTQEDLKCETFFDKIGESKALFVPAYNPSWSSIIGAPLNLFEYDANPEEVAQFHEREYRWRRERLFKELSKNHRLLMCHFHKPDYWQHLYGDKDALYKEEKLAAMYNEMDELAKDILEYAEGKYDWVLFMSDHGLPTGDGHNKNAFYSSSHNLGLQNPHISDFHDIILEQTKHRKEADIDV